MLEGKIRKELRPQDVVVIQDTREQTPLTLDPLRVVTGTLDTGDYSIQGLTHVVAVERKSLQDLVMCVGRERERFDREIQRLMAYPMKALVIEAQICDIEVKSYRGQVEPNAVLGSVMGWQVKGLPVIWARDHDLAGKLTARFLYIAAKRRWAENYSFLESQLQAV